MDGHSATATKQKQFNCSTLHNQNNYFLRQSCFFFVWKWSILINRLIRASWCTAFKMIGTECFPGRADNKWKRMMFTFDFMNIAIATAAGALFYEYDEPTMSSAFFFMSL